MSAATVATLARVRFVVVLLAVAYFVAYIVLPVAALLGRISAQVAK